jgi:3-methyl-2-oxobutanoate hydroxymethyltransferase
LGITHEFKPRFLRRYADLNSVITQAVGRYVDDVKSKEFPNQDEKY